MFSNWKQTIVGYATRQHLRGLALAVFWLSMGVLIWWGIGIRLIEKNSIPTPNEDVLIATSSIPSTPIYTASSSEPRTLRIPSINVRASFEEPLGLQEDGSIGVPEAFDTVGWYKYSPTPGELGPSVILGHVDSYQGPAVLFSLGQVKPGDAIEVDRADGSTVVFRVVGYERVEQSAFPMDRVFNDIPYAGIRLITCSGTYDKVAQRYDRNLVVYGELSEIRNSEKKQE